MGNIIGDTKEKRKRGRLQGGLGQEKNHKWQQTVRRKDCDTAKSIQENALRWGKHHRERIPRKGKGQASVRLKKRQKRGGERGSCRVAICDRRPLARAAQQ